MKATPELVFALRRAAARILDPKEDYQWANTDKCNCGLLVREICGLSENELNKIRTQSKISGWSYVYLDQCHPDRAIMAYCNSTGLPIDFVFETLKSIGFEKGDFRLIEFCLPEWDSMNFDPQGFRDAQYVHDFFLRLANNLESQLTAAQQSQTKREGDNDNGTTERTIRSVVNVTT